MPIPDNITVIAKKLSLAIMATLLSSCSLANVIIKTEGTPDVHLKYSGMSMELNSPAYQVDSAAFSPDGRYVVTGSFDRTLRLWDVKAGRMLRAFKGASSNPMHGVVSSVAVSSDGKYSISGGGDASVKIWDNEKGTVMRVLQESATFSSKVVFVAFTPDNRFAVTANDNTLKLWDISTGKEVRSFVHEGFSNRITAAALSADGKRIASGDPSGNIKIWDLAYGSVIRSLDGSSGIVNRMITSITFSADGRYLLSGGSDMTIRLWDSGTGQLVRSMPEGESQFGVQNYLSVAISPDNRRILSGTLGSFPKLRDAANGKELHHFSGDVSNFTGASGVSQVAFSPDGKYALSAAWDGSTRIWDPISGEEVAILIGFEDDEWLLITSEGYYNTSPRGDRNLSVGLGGTNYTVEQFYDVFYRPDIVAAKLRGEDIRSLVTITMQDAVKSPPPVVEFTTAPSNSDKPMVKVCYQVKSTGGGIGEVRLFHNGKLIQSDGYYRDMAKSSSEKQLLLVMNSSAIYENMRSVALKGKGDIAPVASRSKGETFGECREIEAVPGENEVSIAAFNSGNTVQSYMKTMEFNSSIKPGEPHLYILSIGIDKYKDSAVSLKYAAKDATDIEEKLLKQSATLYRPENIHFELLTDSKAGKGSIMAKVDELSRKIKPNDGFILFVAGHGILLQSQYYMLTSDFDGTLSDKSLMSSNEIVEMSKKIKSLSQIFIFDTCHAGGVDAIVSGLYDARMSVLAKKMGLHVYASASSKEAAMDGYRGNGLFTYTLLDGLNNRREADKNGDSTISLVELGEYAKKETTGISGKIGNLQTPLIINFGKDSPVYRLRKP